MGRARGGRTGRTGGFSLVEVLIAVAIIAGAGVALFALFQSGALEAKVGEDQVKAMMIAQKEIERAKQIAALRRNSLQEFWGSGKNRKRSYRVDDFYQVTVEVDPAKKVTIGSSQAELGEITVAVRWARPGRSGQKVQVSALFDQSYY